MMNMYKLALATGLLISLPVSVCWGQSQVIDPPPSKTLIRTAVHVNASEASNFNNHTNSSCGCGNRCGCSPFTLCKEAAGCGCASSCPNLLESLTNQTRSAFSNLFCRWKSCDHNCVSFCEAAPASRLRFRKPITITLFPCNRECCAKRCSERGHTIQDTDEPYLEPPQPIDDDEGAPPPPPPGARIQPRWLIPLSNQRKSLNQRPAKLISSPGRQVPPSHQAVSKPRIITITDQHSSPAPFVLAAPQPHPQRSTAANQPRLLEQNQGAEFRAAESVSTEVKKVVRQTTTQVSAEASPVFLPIPVNPLRY